MSHLYVTLSDEDKIVKFDMDDQSGNLENPESFRVSGKPGPLAKHPSGQFIYAGRRGTNQVTSFSVDPAGKLHQISEIGLESDPCYMATDRQGQFLLSAYYSGGGVSVHRIGDDGAATGPDVQWIKTGTGAHCIQTDPTNQFVFVPHIAGAGPNAIFQFKFDDDEGILAPNSPFIETPSRQDGPRHFCFHPELNILYTSNEQGCSVTAYEIDRKSGTLSAVQTVSTLPADYDGDNSCSQIQITPSGSFLYAPNRGHDSIAGFKVDPSTGQLTPIGHTPAERVPRAFSIDPQGHFLYAAGLETGKLTSFRINQQTGALESFGTYAVGASPMWVLITHSN